MKSIVPITIDDSVLVSSTVPEDDAPAFDGDATYSIGDTCIEGHKIYQSLVASNAGKLPSANLAGSSPAWSLTGYTNRWRKFDPYVNTLTVQSAGGDMVDVLDVSYCNGLALFGLVGETASIVVANAQGDVVYSETVNLLTESVQNLEDYFYGARQWADVCWFEFPIMTRAIITITITGDKPTAGNYVIGEVQHMGDTQYGNTLPMTDYTVFDVNSFGAIYVSEGAYAMGSEGTLYVESHLLYSRRRVANSLRAIPTAHFCANEVHPDGLHNAMIMYGLLRAYEPSIVRATVQEVDYKIVGVK